MDIKRRVKDFSWRSIAFLLLMLYGMIDAKAGEGRTMSANQSYLQIPSSVQQLGS